MSELQTNQLAEMVERKHACLQRMREMGARQLDLIRAGEMTALLDVLAAKQRLLTQLQQVERTLDPFRHDDPDARLWRTPDDRQRCAARLAECESMLAEIVQDEKLSARELTQRRDATARQLQGTHVASQARDAYAGATPRGTGQLDLCSDS